MKVVVTDYSFPDLSLEEEVLRPHGVQLLGRVSCGEEELIGLVRDADAVLTQFARITPRVIEAMDRSRAIIRYGIGVDNVDLGAAKARSIPVCNVPDYCIDEVADHALAFLLALTRQVVPHSLRVKQGGWGLATPIPAFRTLSQMTVGLVGFGRIGKAVARRLLAFGARVLVHDPGIDQVSIRECECQPVAIEEIWSQCDAVSLHAPSTQATRGMVNRKVLETMKTGCLLINVARGDLVVVDDLVEALANGHLGGAGLDVFTPEPIPAAHPILNFPQVILAPHIASVSPKAVRTLRQTAATLALAAVQGTPLVNVVNGVLPHSRTWKI